MTLNRTIPFPRRRNVSVVTSLGLEPWTAIHHRLERRLADDPLLDRAPELPPAAELPAATAEPDPPDDDPPDVPEPPSALPPEAAVPPLPPADAPAPETWTEGVVAEGV
jgi:hypothetical protein